MNNLLKPGLKLKRNLLSTPVADRNPYYTRLTVALSGIAAFLLLLAVGCDKPTEPPVKTPSSDIGNTMKIEYLWADLERISLKLTKSKMDSSNTLTYVLKRNEVNGADLVIYTGSLKNDTTVIDSGGLRGDGVYVYSFAAYGADNVLKDTAANINAKVLTPTGHEFEWIVDTLGENGNPGISDFWGLDENNVWGVGGVLLPDGGSNVIKWDGSTWSSVPYAKQIILYGIYGFSANQIWVVGNGNYNWGGAAFWDGVKFTEYKFDADKPEYADTIYALQGVWGTAPDDVWAVGQRGTIIHWDGSKWKKVAGINRKYHFYEVTGRSRNEVYTAGKNPVNGEWVLYMYNGITWKTMALGYSHLTRAGIWQAKSGEIFLLGGLNLILKNGRLNDFILGNTYVQNSIRGTAINNIFTVGHGGEIFHFNGIDWKKQVPLPVRVGVTILTKPFVTENHFFVGSITDFKPLVIRGIRKQNK